MIALKTKRSYQFMLSCRQNKQEYEKDRPPLFSESLNSKFLMVKTRTTTKQ